MPYATPEDLTRALGPEALAALADDDADGAADAPVLESVLLLADATVEAHLAGRYVLPLAPAPAIARWWCATLALEALHARRGSAPPAPLAHDAALVRRALEALRDGLAALAGAQPRPAALAAHATRDAEDATFTLEALEDY